MESKDKVELIRSIALLQHLPQEKLEALVSHLKTAAFSKGDVIFEEGSEGDSLYIIIKGQVRIEKKVETRFIEYKELALLSPGDFFGEMALIEETLRSARAVSITESTVFTLERKELFAWLQANPTMALGFLVELVRVISQRLRRTSSELALLYDISHLVTGEFENEKEFLQKVLQHLVPHLEGKWSAAGYIYNPYNMEVELVSTQGEEVSQFPGTLPADVELPSEWTAETTLRVALPGKERPMGFILCHNAEKMTQREKTEAATTLTAAAHVVASALLNIQHQQEEAMKLRLKKQSAYGTTL